MLFRSAAFPASSFRRVCRVLDLSRSALYKVASVASARGEPDGLLIERIHQLILQHPTYGYRRVWAMLRYSEGQMVNRKRVYRLMKINGWMLHQRLATPKPRVKKMRSRAEASNQRWAMDLTHIYCGEDGWGQLGGCHFARLYIFHDHEMTFLTQLMKSGNAETRLILRF